MEHDQSVEFYTDGLVKMRVYFPHGMVDCRHCHFCRDREYRGLFQCVLTDDYIERYALDERHPNCPIEIQETPF